MKRNPTKYSRRGYVSVGLRFCVAAPNLRLINVRFTGRLPRPLPVPPGLVQSQQRGLATTTRASPRGTKRSPCWHSSGPLRDTIGRLGGAASGRHQVVKFVKRNPTKCSKRGYVSVGLRSCVAAPNLRLLDTRFTGRLPRPLPVLPGLVQSQQRGLATTTRTSPRGMKRSPCWLS